MNTLASSELAPEQPEDLETVVTLWPTEFSKLMDSESPENLELHALNMDGDVSNASNSKSSPKLEFELPIEDSKQELGFFAEFEYENECRICHTEGDEVLISPCKCSGSTKWVHESCLVLWFQVSRTSKCELCAEKISVKKYTKPVREWRRPDVKSVGPCSKVDLWYLFVTLFSVSTIIGFVVFQACVKSDDVESTAVFSAIYVLCAFMIVLRVRYFYQWFTRRSFFWQKWRRLNQEWFISTEGPRCEVKTLPPQDPGCELQEVLSVEPSTLAAPSREETASPGSSPEDSSIEDSIQGESRDSSLSELIKGRGIVMSESMV
ncbi:predicted protein [Nematostella vectensis]|uniref:RING-CH-type domain-containing protein n=1 Tax=Nematostella vectensis TaxID=45351 RepID=A7S4C7_NEMVE|nr:E3 ubiquitin-protein ligase MARCHF4 [Nematostella vectensis]EDO41497.1 predicted protein [Nematostella vectensis]|eukprot:XP_001633560.1 predicted protein [Nematostella vectensis]